MVLAFQIVAHGFMIIKMVLRQIGECRRCKLQVCKSMLRQSLGGRFHDDILQTCVGELPEKIVQS